MDERLKKENEEGTLDQLFVLLRGRSRLYIKLLVQIEFKLYSKPGIWRAVDYLPIQGQPELAQRGPHPLSPCHNCPLLSDSHIFTSLICLLGLNQKRSSFLLARRKCFQRQTLQDNMESAMSRVRDPQLQRLWSCETENMVPKEQVNSCIWARWVAVKSWIFSRVRIIQRSRTLVSRHVLIVLDLYSNRKSCRAIEESDTESSTFGEMFEDGRITDWRYVK